MSTMFAAVLEDVGQVALREVKVPEVGPGELLIRVDAALTCGTDLKTIRRGHPLIPLPVPLGHEFAGTVAAVGRGAGAWKEGDPIACVPTAPCLSCSACRRGRESLCERAVAEMVFGAFAQFVRLPARLVARNVFARPPQMDARYAALLEPLSCVVHGAARVDAGTAHSVALIGDGAIALLLLQILRHAGADRILVAGKHQARLEVAAALGADTTVDVTTDTLSDRVADWTSGSGADLVVECVGTPATWESALTLAAKGGTVLMFGGCAAGTSVQLDPFRIHYQEVDVRGAFHYDRAAVRDAWWLLVEGRIDGQALITHERSLADVLPALELARSRTAIKVAIRP